MNNNDDAAEGQPQQPQQVPSLISRISWNDEELVTLELLSIHQLLDPPNDNNNWNPFIDPLDVDHDLAVDRLNRLNEALSRNTVITSVNLGEYFFYSVSYVNEFFEMVDRLLELPNLKVVCLQLDPDHWWEAKHAAKAMARNNLHTLDISSIAIRKPEDVPLLAGAFHSCSSLKVLKMAAIEVQLEDGGVIGTPTVLSNNIIPQKFYEHRGATSSSRNDFTIRNFVFDSILSIPNLEMLHLLVDSPIMDEQFQRLVQKKSLETLVLKEAGLRDNHAEFLSQHLLEEESRLQCIDVSRRRLGFGGVARNRFSHSGLESLIRLAETKKQIQIRATALQVPPPPPGKAQRCRRSFSFSFHLQNEEEVKMYLFREDAVRYLRLKAAGFEDLLRQKESAERDAGLIKVMETMSSDTSALFRIVRAVPDFCGQAVGLSLIDEGGKRKREETADRNNKRIRIDAGNGSSLV